MGSKVIRFDGERTEFLVPSWEELEELTFQLAEQIKASGVKIDRIVTLAKGGWPMSRSLVDFLQVPNIASVGIKFYAGINKRLRQPYIYQNLPVTVQGEKVLLFDDVADSGHSLMFARKYLLDNGVKEVITATLFYKPKSKLKPDFFAYETRAWIIFPYEKIETVKNLTNTWQKAGIDKVVIKKRLKSLGLTKM